jgi:acyl-CoA thioester hydrolase
MTTPEAPEPGTPEAADNLAARYTLTLPVEPDNIDQLGHVNNVVYLRWVQEAATAHWLAATTPAEQAEVAWVVLRHEIDYRHPALPGDVVVAETWVGTATRLAFERHTEFRRAADRRLLATARTLWCPIGRRSGRPMEVSADLRRRFSVGAPPEPSGG